VTSEPVYSSVIALLLLRDLGVVLSRRVLRSESRGQINRDIFRHRTRGGLNLRIEFHRIALRIRITAKESLIHAVIGSCRQNQLRL
jgi:hypothetical protein